MAWAHPLPVPHDPSTEDTWGATLNASLDELEDRVSTLEGTPLGNSAQIPGVVQLADFAGATYDTKLTNALSYAAAQTRIPYIMFPAADITLNTGGRAPFTGMKLVGPGWGPGSKNLEQASGKASNHRVTLGAGIGTGTNALFHSTAQLFGIYVGGLSFSNNRTGQFWSQPSGTLYSCEFNSLTFFGMKSVFGTPSQLAAITGVMFSGYWLVQAHSGGDTQFHVGGSDCRLWGDGFCNIDGDTGNGAYQMDFDNLQKTRVGQIYFTSQGGWRSLRIRGNNTESDLHIYGLITEGRNASTPCHGNVLAIEGGNVVLHGIWAGFGMTAPTTLGGGNNGMIQVSGNARVAILGGSYQRATGVAETVPYLHASGAGTKVTVLGVTGSGTWTGKPRYQAVSGATIIDLDSSLQSV